MKDVASLKGRLGWQNLRADEYTEEGPFLVTSEHLVRDEVDWASCHHVSRERYEMAPQIQLRSNDLVMMKDGAAMGKLGFIKELPGPACLNSHLLLFRPLDARVTNKFLYYVLASPSFTTYMHREKAGSTFFGISQESVGSFRLAIPPRHVLDAIVVFLDRETAKIDALISGQQRLMELLQERRQAVISHAVTKGLNPGAPMKPSGVEWLGDVPAHWELVKGARIGTLFGSEQVAEEQVVDDGTLPYIKVGSLSQDSFDVESWTWFVSPEVERHVTSRANYVVFPKRGAAIFTNKVNIVRVESLIDPNLMGWRINERARTDYVAFALKARGLTELADVSTVPQINNKHIAPQLFPLPPLSEQNAIVEHLTLEWSRIDALALDAKRAVDLLSERRAALISAAVTGQIDVRGFVEREAA